MESLAGPWKELSLVYLGLRGVVIPKVGAGEIESNSSSFFFFFFCFPVYQFLWTRGEGLESLGTLAPS